MRSIVFFNNKGGVGKTTLVYHLAHMLARLGQRILAVDLDPQANLTSAFFDEERLELLWGDGDENILSAISPILEGTGDIGNPQPIAVTERLWVLPGDLGLSRFEDRLSQAWPNGFQNDAAALRTTSSFYRLIRTAAETLAADLVLLDVGPNLGAINRAGLLSADFLIVPLAADLFSLQGLRNLGPTVRRWRLDWKAVRERATVTFPLPAGLVQPVGYVVLQHAVRLDRPARAFDRWLKRIPDEYQKSVLGREGVRVPQPDPSCLAMLRNYRSLMPMAQDARKPIFDLRPADGAIGSHAALARTCFGEFKKLGERVIEVCREEDESALVASE